MAKEVIPRLSPSLSLMPKGQEEGIDSGPSAKKAKLSVKGKHSPPEGFNEDDFDNDDSEEKSNSSTTEENNTGCLSVKEMVDVMKATRESVANALDRFGESMLLMSNSVSRSMEMLAQSLSTPPNHPPPNHQPPNQRYPYQSLHVENHYPSYREMLYNQQPASISNPSTSHEDGFYTTNGN
eukprot:gene20663-22703_t